MSFGRHGVILRGIDVKREITLSRDSLSRQPAVQVAGSTCIDLVKRQHVGRLRAIESVTQFTLPPEVAPKPVKCDVVRM